MACVGELAIAIFTKDGIAHVKSTPFTLYPDRENDVIGTNYSKDVFGWRELGSGMNDSYFSHLVEESYILIPILNHMRMS